MSDIQEQKEVNYNTFLNSAAARIKRHTETRESDIEEAFNKHASLRGCMSLKLVILKQGGFPDRTVLCPNGKIFFIEFKRAGKKQSRLQVVIQKKLEQLGFSYFVCDRIGQAEKILKGKLC